MKSRGRLITHGLPLLCALLFVVYIALNWEKVGVEGVGYHYLFGAAEKQVLIIKKDNALLAQYDLPTSDMFDQSGERQLNFRYLEKEALEKIAGALSSGQFWLNDTLVDNVIIENDINSLAIALPGKKLFLLAPPHAKQFAEIVQKEGENRSDVVSCTGSTAFCLSINILALGGVTEVKDKILKEDTITHYLAPRGRWVSDEMDVKFFSSSAKEIVVTGVMHVPFDKQSITIKDPKGSVYRVLENGPRQGDYPEYLGPFTFQVKLPLEKGETVLRIVFKNTTEKKSVGYIPKFSGVLTHLQLSPVS